MDHVQENLSKLTEEKATPEVYNMQRRFKQIEEKLNRMKEMNHYLNKEDGM